MIKWSLALLVLVPSLLSAKPLIHSSDFRPNPAFVPVKLRQETTPLPAKVEQVGEVIILEGDDDLVSSDGMGGYAVALDNYAQNPLAITKRIYTRYGDDFDEIILFTSFDDQGAAGALAYEVSTQQDVAGLGQAIFNDNVEWGVPGYKLHAFVNMMRWDQYAAFGRAMTDPLSPFYSTLGQEFAHRWLAFMHYKDKDGNDSAAMLGRDDAHWASTLQASGSMIDGNELVPNMDGTFTVQNYMTRYSPLDMYAMGLIGKEEVPPFFLLQNAVSEKGKAINPKTPLRQNQKITGTREDITIDQVIAAVGERSPGVSQAAKSFRLAFVLLTRPGEKAAEVVPAAQTLNQVRKIWENNFKTYTDGNGAVCTQVSAPCGAAAAQIIGGDVRENGGNHNDVVEPGEPVTIKLTLANDSQTEAKNVVVRASGDLVQTAAEQSIASLAPAATGEALFDGVVPADAVCGQTVTVDAEAVVDGNTFRGFVQVVPGITQALLQTFETDDGGLKVNVAGTDTTTMNGWQYGTPVTYGSTSGWVFQPAACHGDSQKCWFTGLQEGHRPMTDSSVGVGNTTLTTAPIDLSATYKPELRFFAWYQAIDFSNVMRGGSVNPNIPMIVEASIDGTTWVQIDSIAGADTTWLERRIPLDGIIPADARSLTLRFTASSPAIDQLVEAGVDDIEVITLSAACNPANANMETPQTPMAPTGCACSFASTTMPPGLLVIVFLIALPLVARRRRAR